MEENNDRMTEIEAMLKRMQAQIGIDKETETTPHVPKSEAKQHSITKYSLNSWEVCSAEPGKLFIQGNHIKTKADLAEFIAILQKAAEVANLP